MQSHLSIVLNPKRLINSFRRAFTEVNAIRQENPLSIADGSSMNDRFLFFKLADFSGFPIASSSIKNAPALCNFDLFENIFWTQKDSRENVRHFVGMLCKRFSVRTVANCRSVKCHPIQEAFSLSRWPECDSLQLSNV